MSLTTKGSLALLLAVALLAGCGDDGPKRRSIASRRKAAKQAEQAAKKGEAPDKSKRAPIEVSEDEGLYEHEEGAKLRDPFYSYLAEFQRKAEGPATEDVRRSPTEMYDVGQYRLIGVISGTPVPKAMVVDPTGFGHVIRPGDRIGKQGGRVAAIYSNEVVIRTPNPRLGDEETSLYLYPPGSEQAAYRLNVVASEIEEEEAEGSEEQQFLQQLDLQRILSGAAARQATSQQPGAGGQGRGEGGKKVAADLPAIPMVPVLPGFMVKRPIGGGAVAPEPQADGKGQGK